MAAPSRRVYIFVTLFAFALVLLPFLFWYDTWFGRRLNDEQVDKYLHETNRPRRAQQALAQIGERMARGDAGARRWYPRVIELAGHTSPEMRNTAAWIMGQDPKHEPFHAALKKLISDSSPMVRRNAALALAAFGDAAGRAELRLMLRPHEVKAPRGGLVSHRLKPGDYVNPGTLVARVDNVEVRSELPGEVRPLPHPEGARVAAGEKIVELGADESHAWESLRALYLVGTREDLDDARRFVRSPEERLRRQAGLTIARIEGTKQD
ncbi:MAG: HEAT repeat domain-containing protein [Bryobacteraceae bacterium]